MEPLCCVALGSATHTVVYVNGAPKAKLDHKQMAPIGTAQRGVYVYTVRLSLTDFD